MVQRRALCTTLETSEHPFMAHCGVQFCACSQRFAIDLCDLHGSSETIVRVSSISSVFFFFSKARC